MNKKVPIYYRYRHLFASVSNYLCFNFKSNCLVKGASTRSINHHVNNHANQNHLKILIPIKNSTINISKVVTLPSNIAARLLSYAVSTADNQDLPVLSSSFNLSKIRILASIPIPNERIIAAIPLKENA